MKGLYYILPVALFFCVSCNFNLNKADSKNQRAKIEVKRYDRIESRYLTTGDFAALQQMNIEYPTETRTLIENVLQIGEVNDYDINSKFLNFYQDTTLQSIITDVELSYGDMSDINKRLNDAFARLRKMIPAIDVPYIYSQIGALNQSIVVGDGTIGISLDKYLGKDYPLYKRYYNEGQRKNMTREYIIPDCLCFYLLSVYPMHGQNIRSQYDKNLHIGKILWTVNKALGKDFFSNKYVSEVARFVQRNPQVSIDEMLKMGKLS